MTDGLRRLFVIASVILLAIVGGIFWVNHQFSVAAESALEKVNRIAELQVQAQRASALTQQFLNAANPQEERAAGLALEEVSAFFGEAQSLSFAPTGAVCQWLYDYLSTPARQDAYDNLADRLALLAKKTRQLTMDETRLDQEFTASAISALTRADLFIDLDILIQWHRSVLTAAIRLVEVVQILAVPAIAWTLLSLWRFLVKPLRDRETAARKKLRESEGKALELAEEAAAASKAKSEFLATMSHEIRTPMHGVLGLVEVLNASIDDPKHRRTLTALRESGETLMQILNDVLDLTKIEEGKLQMEAIEFAPSALAPKIETLFAPAAQSKGVDLYVECNRFGEALRVGDPNRVMQILHNVVGNAIKFTEQGSVHVRIASAADAPVVIDVIDTGIGMTDAQIETIFEGFQQADSSTARRFGGTGLGMSIVKRLVDAMGGQIAIESRIGRGTKVQISLPLESAARTFDRHGDRSAIGTIPPDLRVLAADDIDTNRLVIEKMLEMIGLDPVMANGGEEAIEACARERFDLLLLDISMPGIDGIEALHTIREDERRRGLDRTPAIAVTANVLSHQVNAYMEEGFDDHLAKPIDVKELKAIMMRLLQRQKRARDAA